jgi:hypothetical protein
MESWLRKIEGKMVKEDYMVLKGSVYRGKICLDDRLFKE